MDLSVLLAVLAANDQGPRTKDQGPRTKDQGLPCRVRSEQGKLKKKTTSSCSLLSNYDYDYYHPFHLTSGLRSSGDPIVRK